MHKIDLSLLRGVCQMPAYVAYETGLFRDEGLEVTPEVVATAWQIPQKLGSGACQFAVMPWTRVAAAELEGLPLVVVAGSGHEEAAIVVRCGLSAASVRSVAVPRRGGIKDLTAMGMIRSLGWEQVDEVRQPSGDGAIIALFGRGADAAAMVEPYATMLEQLGVGQVVRRTGDLWKGAPGCSLATTKPYRDREPGVVEAVVRAFVRGAQIVRERPQEAAEIASRYIGIDAGFIREALRHNRPDVDAIRNRSAMTEILELMQRLGYTDRIPSDYVDLSFLDKVSAVR